MTQDRKIDVRLPRMIYYRIEREVALNPDKYQSRSHFVKVCIAEKFRRKKK